MTPEAVSKQQAAAPNTTATTQLLIPTTQLHGPASPRPPPSAVLVLQLRLLLLGLGKREVARADLRVQLVLDPIDVGGTRVRLRPQVPGIGRVPTELEADQMIL